MNSIPGMPAPGEKMTQAQKDKLLEMMPPELREQAKAISAAMADMGAICKTILPPKEDPDQPVPQHQLVMALASAPSFHALGEHFVPETLDKLEKVLVSHGAFNEGELFLPEAAPAPSPEDTAKSVAKTCGRTNCNGPSYSRRWNRWAKNACRTM